LANQIDHCKSDRDHPARNNAIVNVSGQFRSEPIMICSIFSTRRDSSRLRAARASTRVAAICRRIIAPSEAVTSVNAMRASPAQSSLINSSPIIVGMLEMVLLLIHQWQISLAVEL
jgi:hypothetical protein